MERISWTDRVRNEELLSQEGQKYPSTIKGKKKKKFIGHILRGNCILNHIIKEMMEGRIEVTGKRGRRHRQLLGDLKKI